MSLLVICTSTLTSIIYVEYTSEFSSNHDYAVWFESFAHTRELLSDVSQCLSILVASTGLVIPEYLLMFTIEMIVLYAYSRLGTRLKTKAQAQVTQYLRDSSQSANRTDDDSN